MAEAAAKATSLVELEGVEVKEVDSDATGGTDDEVSEEARGGGWSGTLEWDNSSATSSEGRNSTPMRTNKRCGRYKKRARSNRGSLVEALQEYTLLHNSS